MDIDEKAGRYSGRDFILIIISEVLAAQAEHEAHFVSDREAALAMTVLLRFWMAVITSSSVCVAGGRRRHSQSSGFGGDFHGGSCGSSSVTA